MSHHGFFVNRFPTAFFRSGTGDPIKNSGGKIGLNMMLFWSDVLSLASDMNGDKHLAP